MAFIRSWPSPVDLHFITGKFTGGNYLRISCGYPWNPRMEAGIRRLGQLLAKQRPE